MFDPNFDPYQDLHNARLAIMNLQQNERVLLNAINEQSELLKELSLQHQQVTHTLKLQSRELVKIKQKVLESSHN
jgi:hypothetical protein